MTGPAPVQADRTGVRRGRAQLTPPLPRGAHGSPRASGECTRQRSVTGGSFKGKPCPQIQSRLRSKATPSLTGNG